MWLYLYAVEGWDYRDVGEAFGVSRDWVGLMLKPYTGGHRKEPRWNRWRKGGER